LPTEYFADRTPAALIALGTVYPARNELPFATETYAVADFGSSAHKHCQQLVLPSYGQLHLSAHISK